MLRRGRLAEGDDVNAKYAYKPVHSSDSDFDLQRELRAVLSDSQSVPSDPSSLLLTVDFSFLFSPRGGISASSFMAVLARRALQTTKLALLFPRQTVLARGLCSPGWLA